MPEELPSIAYVREVKGMISARIDHQLDGRSLARAPFHPPFAIFGRRPIVKFADQDNGWNSQLIGGNAGPCRQGAAPRRRAAATFRQSKVRKGRTSVFYKQQRQTWLQSSL